MTREEAHNLLKQFGYRDDTTFLSALEALGLLKFDESKPIIKNYNLEDTVNLDESLQIKKPFSMASMSDYEEEFKTGSNLKIKLPADYVVNKNSKLLEQIANIRINNVHEGYEIGSDTSLIGLINAAIIIDWFIKSNYYISQYNIQHDKMEVVSSPRPVSRADARRDLGSACAAFLQAITHEDYKIAIKDLKDNIADWENSE